MATKVQCGQCGGEVGFKVQTASFVADTTWCENCGRYTDKWDSDGACTRCTPRGGIDPATKRATHPERRVL